MTPRQERITAVRVQDIGAAEAEARCVNRGWGDLKAYKASVPRRKWVKTERGWMTVDTNPALQKRIDERKAEAMKDKTGFITGTGGG